jgi:DNA-binding Lrp family transcriptional regulator
MRLSSKLTVFLESVKKAEAEPGKPTVNSRLDDLDIRLLRQLLQSRGLLALDSDFRKPFRDIAKILNVHEDTVRNRAKRLEKIGFVAGWNVLLNPCILGLKESVVWFDVPAAVSKADLIDGLKVVPGVFVIVNFYGPLLIVFFRHEDSEPSLRKRIQLIEKLSKAEKLTLAQVPWPDVATKMKESDWSIVRALQHDPRKSYTAISEYLGLSTRTVQRRLRMMLKDAMIYNLPTLNYPAVNGTIIAGLIVGLSPGDTSELVRSITVRLDEYLWYFFPVLSHRDDRIIYCLISLALPNATRAREILDWVRAQNGVANARVEFADDQITLVENLDNMIAGTSALARSTQRGRVG